MRIGVIQLTSVLDYRENLRKIRGFLDEAKILELEAIFLPECFYSLSNGVESTPYLVKGINEHYQNIRQLALDYSIYILGGSAATLEQKDIMNRSFNFDADGNDLGFYDKIHLFSCDLPGEKGESKIINESDLYVSGKESKIIKAGPLKIGLSICFDVRYPQMYQDYRENGANLLTVAAAFTVPTGKAHWETLVRARAIENQCFVVASAQWGRHNDRISTFGHSLIVDPWGTVLANAKEGEKLIHSDLDLGQVVEVRQRIKL